MSHNIAIRAIVIQFVCSQCNPDHHGDNENEEDLHFHHSAHDDNDQEEEKWGFRGHCMQLTPSPPGATICGGSQVPSQSYFIVMIMMIYIL